MGFPDSLEMNVGGGDTELEASEGKSVLKDREKRPLDPLNLFNTFLGLWLAFHLRLHLNTPIGLIEL